MTYGAWVATGILAGWLVALVVPRARSDLTPPQQHLILLSAIIGAIVGAYVLEIPADVWGWAWTPPDLPPHATLIGGRTVLGGLIGGWLAVEFAKQRAHIEVPTGDRFALPLAIALTFGRLGCASAGCCAGQACGAWWAWHGRFPVQLIEAAFHGMAAVMLAAAAWNGRAQGRHLAMYLTCYAVVRFLLEFWRCNPPILLGLTWYQYLSLVLLVIAGSTWLRRLPARTAAVP